MKSPSFSVRSVAWVENKRNDESSPRRDLGTRRVKPKGLTSVLRSQRKNMIGYMTLRQFFQPAFERDLSTTCLLNFRKFSTAGHSVISAVTSSPLRAISKAPSTSICFHFENKMFIESFSQLCLFWHSVFWIRLAQTSVKQLLFVFGLSAIKVWHQSIAF